RLVVEAGVGHVEAALEGLGGGGVVARVDAQEAHPLVGVVGVDGGEVAVLGPAGRAGRVPVVEDDDVAPPVGEVDLLVVVGGAGELDRPGAVRLVPRGPGPVTGLVDRKSTRLNSSH